MGSLVVKFRLVAISASHDDSGLKGRQGQKDSENDNKNTVANGDEWQGRDICDG